jgi:hypothetical protein
MVMLKGTPTASQPGKAQKFLKRLKRDFTLDFCSKSKQLQVTFPSKL